MTVIMSPEKVDNCHNEQTRLLQVAGYHDSLWLLGLKCCMIQRWSHEMDSLNRITLLMWSITNASCFTINWSSSGEWCPSGTRCPLHAQLVLSWSSHWSGVRCKSRTHPMHPPHTSNTPSHLHHQWDKHTGRKGPWYTADGCQVWSSWRSRWGRGIPGAASFPHCMSRWKWLPPGTVQPWPWLCHMHDVGRECTVTGRREVQQLACYDRWSECAIKGIIHPNDEYMERVSYHWHLHYQ